MKRILQIFVFFLVPGFAVCQNSSLDYRQYFQIADYAKYRLDTGHPEEYQQLIQTLSPQFNQYPYDNAKLGVMLYKSNKKQAVFYLKKAIEKGYSLSSITDKFDKQKDKDYLSEQLAQDHTDFLNRRNNEFVRFLDSIAELDQLYRAQTFDLPDSVRFEKQRIIDSSNLLGLKNRIEKFGWPGYSKVGCNHAGIAFIVVLHGTRQFPIESDIFQFFQTLLLEEIKLGNFAPVSYANWIDQYHAWTLKDAQPYGSMADPNGVLYPIESIQLCNTNRLSIGLCTLEQYLQITGYTLK